jgi:hypothetical protein
MTSYNGILENGSFSKLELSGRVNQRYAKLQRGKFKGLETDLVILI